MDTKTKITFELSGEDAMKVIRYVGLLDRVRKYQPDAKNIDAELTARLDHEDRRTMRQIFIERSQTFSINNCANHASVTGYEGCQRTDSDSCPDCECWEEIEPRPEAVENIIAQVERRDEKL